MFVPCRSRQFLRTVFLCISLLTVIFILRTSLPGASKRVKYVINEVQFNWETSTSDTTTVVEQDDEEVDAEVAEDWALDEANIPDVAFMIGTKKGGPKYIKPNCAKFPNLFTVRFSNTHWQFQETANESYYLYSAYLDMRGNNGSEITETTSSVVRVLGMSDALLMDQKNATLKMCQFWYKDRREPELTPISDLRMIWNHKWGRGHYYPYLITCQLPLYFKQVPVSVSVVSKKCESATNNLNIIHRDRVELSQRTPQKNFGVCVKALDFPHGYMLSRLVEWIETLRLLGADKLFLYEFYVDSDIKKVLDYYESKGIIDVKQTTLPGELPNHPQLRHLYIRGKKGDKRLTELIPYNDCILRNMYDYKYVAVLDTDEIIMPKDNNMNWNELIKTVNKEDIGLESIKKEAITTYCSRNYYFLDGMLSKTNTDDEIAAIPLGFHMLRHVYRSNNHTGNGYAKCFHSTEHTLGVHNHYPLFCRNKCKRHYFNLERAQMNHYRSTCVPEIKNCTQYLTDTERDTNLWKHKDILMSRVQTILEIVN
ncbi:hypothetical protein Ocin01_16460 [Orchesella cincta]|uniref:Glycosyltransferase family 92 protein n=1 Tax=Orchesella cincta TaxID=48709 RepID=A0A1D2MBD5_ORCCI|nr:hypothetical protein Ocin01_16460 [Orchesella cincta]